MNRNMGSYITSSVAGESFQAFLPAPLPPVPALEFDAVLLNRLEQAGLAVGRLDSIAEEFSEVDLFLHHFVRKEAVLSSQIEGTQSSFSDLLMFEYEQAPGTPVKDVQGVSDCVAALQYGWQRLREGFPLSVRLLREMHGILFAHGRGAAKTPGEFRRSQVWLGGSRPGNARFVPPPPERLMECLDPFERYLHAEENRLPVLIRAAFVHVQFETIHPFLDGNGRLGRLLISLLLCEDGALRQPLLYLSLFFKQQRTEYYDRLQQVRINGDWEGWVSFFLQGVKVTADQAVATARNAMALFARDRKRIQAIGRLAGSCLLVHDHLQRKPLCRIGWVADATKINRTTISNCLEQLQELGIVRETTGHRRNRLFAYDEYMKLLAEGTEPLFDNNNNTP